MSNLEKESIAAGRLHCDACNYMSKYLEGACQTYGVFQGPHNLSKDKLALHV